MTGTPSHQSIRRLRTTGRISVAIGAILVLAAFFLPGFTPSAEAQPEEKCIQYYFAYTDGHVDQGEVCGSTPENNLTKAEHGIHANNLHISCSDDYSVFREEGYSDAAPGWDSDGISDLGGHLILDIDGVAQWGVDKSWTGEDGEDCGIAPPPPPDPVGDPAIVKSGPNDPVQLGASYSFTLTVTNDGQTGSSTGAFTVGDTVPSTAGTVDGVAEDSDAASCSNTGNVITCDITDLDDDDTVTVTVSMTAPSDNEACDTVTNTASLTTQGDNSSTANDSSSDDVTIDGCETTTVVTPTPSVDVEKLVSLDGINFLDADSAPGAEFSLQGEDATQDVWFQVVVTNDSGDGTELTLNSLTDTVQLGGGEALDLEDCTFPEGVLEDGESVTCDLGPFTAVVGTQHTNEVAVSASGGGETVQDSDPANYLGEQVAGVVIDRPDPEPAPEPDVEPEPEPDVEAEPEPAPEVLGVTEELPRTGPEDLWLAGLALMLLGAGLLTIARGKAMDATAYASGTWWTNHTP